MIITSRKNQTIVKSKGLLAEKKLREKEGLFGAEGVKLCEEAINAGVEIAYAIITEEAEKKFSRCTERLKKVCPVFYAEKEVYESLSGQKSPQEIFIAGKILDKSEKVDTILSKEKILLLDCIQDSGNMGTMLRTAEAFGIEGAILSPDCADIWSPKVLRASMGSVFRLPVAYTELSGAISELKKRGCEVYAAMLDETAERLGSFSFGRNAAVLIGNEGHGVSKELAAECKKVYIPIQGAESLNAAIAAAVICYEMSRQAPSTG